MLPTPNLLFGLTDPISALLVTVIASHDNKLIRTYKDLT